MDPIPTDVLELESAATTAPRWLDRIERRLERWAAGTAMGVIGVGLLSVLFF